VPTTFCCRVRAPNCHAEVSGLRYADALCVNHLLPARLAPSTKRFRDPPEVAALFLRS
jgi:hypothetical protein